MKLMQGSRPLQPQWLASALTATVACLCSCSTSFVWKDIQKHIQKISGLSGLISILSFY